MVHAALGVVRTMLRCKNITMTRSSSRRAQPTLNERKSRSLRTRPHLILTSITQTRITPDIPTLIPVQRREGANLCSVPLFTSIASMRQPVMPVLPVPSYAVFRAAVLK